MKRLISMAALAALAMTAACRTNEAPSAYANPVDECKNKPTQEARDECMQNVVADVALSVKRESERKPPR
jgi:hypothetical protein